MNEMVTYPSGGPGKNAVSDADPWTKGTTVPLLNFSLGKTEERPFKLKAINIEQASLDTVYEMVFSSGTPGGEDEEQIFTQRFAKGQFPFTIPIQLDRTFLGGTTITAKLMDAMGSGSISFSIQYEADPGNVRAS